MELIQDAQTLELEHRLPELASELRARISEHRQSGRTFAQEEEFRTDDEGLAVFLRIKSYNVDKALESVSTNELSCFRGLLNPDIDYGLVFVLALCRSSKLFDFTKRIRISWRTSGQVS